MGVMMDKNVWLEFGEYDEHKTHWMDNFDVDDNIDKTIDTLLNHWHVETTYIETGKTRNTSPNGTQCFIHTPWFGRESGYVDTLKMFAAIRDNDGMYWVMQTQIALAI